MPEESPETLERLATEIALAERQDAPRNRALYWYLVVICLMPAMLSICVGILISYSLREAWLDALPGYGYFFFYCLIIYPSIFILGIIHSRILDALYHRDTAQLKSAHWKRTIQFFFLQALASSVIVLHFWNFFLVII